MELGTVASIAFAVVHCLWWTVTSVISMWIYSDARIRRIDGAMRWGMLNCFLPWIGFSRYLKCRRAFLPPVAALTAPELTGPEPASPVVNRSVPLLVRSATNPSRAVISIKEVRRVASAFLQDPLNEKAVYMVSWSLVLSVGANVMSVIIASASFLVGLENSLPWYLAWLCFPYVIGAVISAATLVAAWGFGLVDLVVSSDVKPKTVAAVSTTSSSVNLSWWNRPIVVPWLHKPIVVWAVGLSATEKGRLRAFRRKVLPVVIGLPLICETLFVVCGSWSCLNAYGFILFSQSLFAAIAALIGLCVGARRKHPIMYAAIYGGSGALLLPLFMGLWLIGIDEGLRGRVRIACEREGIEFSE